MMLAVFLFFYIIGYFKVLLYFFDVFDASLFDIIGYFEVVFHFFWRLLYGIFGHFFEKKRHSIDFFDP